MVLNAYSLLDTKTGLYSPPFFLGHDALAMRAVYELSNDKMTTPAKYPDDYVLYRVGIFDDNTGTMGSNIPTNLGAVSALRAAFSNGAGI